MSSYQPKDQYLRNVWDILIQYLQTNQNITSEIIDNYVKEASLYSLTDEKAIILAPNIIIKSILSPETEILAASLRDALHLDHPIKVEIYQQSELPSANLSQADLSLSQDLSEEFASMPIQKDKTFDSFIVGDSNRESQAAALACAINPAKFFNPLFIFGNSGLGKTHLLMAIANYIQQRDPHKKVYYTESLKFVECVVKAIKENKIDAFKQFMFSVDVLLVDDIQFLAGKEKSHEVFFSIYNELVNNHKQVCLASDRQPKEIKGLEERLISRFSSGLTVGIDSPEFETSKAILLSKMKQNGYDPDRIDEKGIDYIASNFSSNIRDLEGAWNRVLFYAIEFQPEGGVIRFETVANALHKQAVVSDKNGLSPKKIIKTVADYYGLTRQQLTSKTRTKNIANARHIAIYLCRKLLNLPYNKIGNEFGGRDHSTIISACTKVEKEMKKSQAYHNAISDLERQLSS